MSMLGPYNIFRESDLKLLESPDRSDGCYLAMRAANIGYWDLDLAKNEIYFSRNFAKYANDYSDESILSFDVFTNSIHEEDKKDVLAILEAHLSRGFEFNVDFRFQKQDANYMWVNMRGQCIWDKENAPLRMLGSIQDITNWRLAFEELSSSNQSLERFAYICSHDLKEPARIVESYSSLLKEKFGDALDEKGLKYLGYVESGSHQMQEMIQAILKYSQLRHKNLYIEDVDLNQELTRVKANLEMSIKSTNAEISYSDLPTIKVDRMQIFQVLQNLISNAIKFSKKSPIIDINALDSSDEWKIIIKDNGIGIPEKEQKRIFQVFNRLHKRSEYPGNGLGLNICQQIISKHGGKLWVESSESKGSTFYFTLPKKINLRSDLS